MNPVTRNIIVTGVVLIVVALIGTFVEWIEPVQAHIASLQQQVAQANGNEQLQSAQLKSLQASDSVIASKMAELKLFDLRSEERPYNIEEARSNTLLTELLDIFEGATISVQALDPIASADLPIITASNSAPIADVNQRNYQMTATGLYRDWIVALAALRKLPPTITVSHYKMEYLSKVGNQAQVGVTMDLGFNFLLRPQQGSKLGAGGSSGIQGMLMHMGGQQSALPTVNQTVAAVGQWLCPPAEAAVRRIRRQTKQVGSIRRVNVRANPDGVLRRVVLETGLDTISRVVVPPRRNLGVRSHLEAHIWRVQVPPPGSAITVRPQLAALTVPSVSALHLATAPGPLSALASAAMSTERPLPAASPTGHSTPIAIPVSNPTDTAPLITMPVGANSIQVGRADPFWPIIDATDDASLARWEAEQRAKGLAAGLKGKDLDAMVPPAPPLHHDISVLGIVEIGNLSAAMLRVDGLPARVSPGSDIGTDYQVKSIRSDFVMIQTPHGLRRYDLLRTWQAPLPPPISGTAAHHGTISAPPALPVVPSM